MRFLSISLILLATTLSAVVATPLPSREVAAAIHVEAPPGETITSYSSTARAEAQHAEDAEEDDTSVLAKDFTSRVVLIRHGEKPKSGAVGLSRAGRKRAQCLRKVFGKKGKHNFGLIIAQGYNHATRARVRPYLTVKPLASDLGLKVDLSCERDDASCVRKVVAKFAKKSNKDVLICWKHSFLHEITHALGADSKKDYPDDRFDLMWTIDHKKTISRESEKCAGLDDDRPQYEVEDDGEEEEVDPINALLDELDESNWEAEADQLRLSA